jgi:hypothetical protein
MRREKEISHCIEGRMLTMERQFQSAQDKGLNHKVEKCFN